jgi:hypothetical protein
MGAICPAGGIQDGEACGLLLNDPCDPDAPGVPNFVTDGDTICGTCFTYVTQDPTSGADVEARDRDYSLYTHAGGAIEVTSVSGADMANFIVPFDPTDVDCAIGPIAGWLSTAGAPTTERVFAPAGDYYILAMAPDFVGFDCGVGDFEYAQTITSDVAAVCEVAAEPGDDIEAEVCETDTNGGCFNLPDSPATYENISEGVPFVGTLWSGIDVDGDSEIDGRDLDWMLYDHPGGAITYTIITDAPEAGVSGFVIDVSDCDNIAVPLAFGTDPAFPCISATDTSTYLPPAQYAIVAGISFVPTGEVDPDGNDIFGPAQGISCCNYRATVTSDTTVLPPLDPCEGVEDDVCSVVPDFIYPANASEPVLIGGSVACSPDAGVTTTENTFANPYSASAIQPGTELSLSCVSFAMQFSGVGSSIPATIQVWLDTNGGVPTAPGVDLSELGSAQYCADGDGIYQVSFPEPVVIPADADFVVSLSFPASETGFAGLGATDAPTVSDTYILSASCGITSFLNMNQFGPVDWGVELYFGGDVSLPCPTDLDDDGDTDFNDILIVLSNWGTDGTAGGDSDENGTVDFNDLILLLSAFGPCP